MNLPNKLTILRMIMIPVFLVVLYIPGLGMAGNIAAAAIFILASITDFLDGKIARTKKNRTEVEKRFGIQIDSLSDIVCFGVAPAVLCYCFGMRGVIGVAILMFYVLAGLIRLAWFNVMEEQRQEETAEKRECYQGLPITSMAIAPGIFPSR